MTGSVPILMYHRVSPYDSSSSASNGADLGLITVTPEAFASQMGWLARFGYTPVTLESLMDARAGQGRLPKRPVVLTFDDGYQDAFDNALPVLRRYGFTATFFLVAGSVGDTARWDRDRLGWEFPLFDWDSARSLHAEGFEIGAHTMTHPDLTALRPGAASREIVESRSVIEREIGHPIHHFAYPFGIFDDNVRSYVDSAGFRSACSVLNGRSRANDDPLTLRRVLVHGRDTTFDFAFRMLGKKPYWQIYPAWNARLRSAFTFSGSRR